MIVLITVCLDTFNIAVLLVQWKKVHDTLQCLKALVGMKQPPLSIVVVDNASPQNIVDALIQEWSAVWRSCRESLPCLRREDEPLPEGVECLPRLDGNRAFAGGNNAALRAISG